MYIYKFGGTSQKDYTSLVQCASIIRNAKHNDAVVVSAPAGITDLLLAGVNAKLTTNKFPQQIFENISNRFRDISSNIPKAKADIEQLLEELNIQTKIDTQGITDLAQDKYIAKILSFGENIQATLFTYLLNDQKIPAQRMPQTLIEFSDGKYTNTTHNKTQNLNNKSFLKSSKDIFTYLLNYLRPSNHKIPQTQTGFNNGSHINATYNRRSDLGIEHFLKSSNQISVIGGFYGFNSSGEIMVFGRGGSDLTQTLIARAVKASACYNYTDVDGIKPIDPRRLSETEKLELLTIPELNYAQTQELSGNGAKVLHAKCIDPLMENNIPLYVINTFNPNGPRTKIHDKTSDESKLLAVTGKENYTIITLNSGSMVDAHGYLLTIGKIFENVNIETITSSKVEISVGFSDSTAKVNELVDELSKYGKVRVDKNMSLVAIVGNNIGKNPSLMGDFFNTLSAANIPVIQTVKSNDYSTWISVPSEQYTSALAVTYRNLLKK